MIGDKSGKTGAILFFRPLPEFCDDWECRGRVFTSQGQRPTATLASLHIDCPFKLLHLLDGCIC